MTVNLRRVRDWRQVGEQEAGVEVGGADAVLWCAGAAGAGLRWCQHAGPGHRQATGVVVGVGMVMLVSVDVVVVLDVDMVVLVDVVVVVDADVVVAMVVQPPQAQVSRSDLLALAKAVGAGEVCQLLA